MREDFDQTAYDDEIDLAQLFLVLWKRKWIIVIITVLIVSAALVVALTSPKIFKAYVVFEPGVIDVASDGKFVYLDSVLNIKGKIDSNAYGQRLIAALGANPHKNNTIEFKTELPNKANIIKVSYEVERDEIDRGVKLLHQLVEELQTDYADDIQLKKDEYNNHISMKKNQIQNLELRRKDLGSQVLTKERLIKEKYDQIEIQKTSVDGSDQKIQDFLQELKKRMESTDSYIKQRGNLQENQTQNTENGIGDLFYSATIQQNVAFFNELKNQISYLRTDKESSQVSIERLQKDIDTLYLDIERIKKEKDETILSEIDSLQAEINRLNSKVRYIQGIKMISEPTATTYPIKPNVKMNLILSLFIGLIVSVFIAFIVEYISNARKDLHV